MKTVILRISHINEGVSSASARQTPVECVQADCPPILSLGFSPTYFVSSLANSLFGAEIQPGSFHACFELQLLTG